MYTEHAKFQKASFNSNWDVKQWNKMFWIDTFMSPNTFFCYNFSFGSIPSPHQVHSIAFLQQHLVGEVKVLIQNFLFHHVLHVGEGWRSRQVFHLERAGGQCFTNISCFCAVTYIQRDRKYYPWTLNIGVTSKKKNSWWNFLNNWINEKLDHVV